MNRFRNIQKMDLHPHKIKCIFCTAGKFFFFTSEGRGGNSVGPGCITEGAGGA